MYLSKTTSNNLSGETDHLDELDMHQVHFGNKTIRKCAFE